MFSMVSVSLIPRVTEPENHGVGVGINKADACDKLATGAKRMARIAARRQRPKNGTKLDASKNLWCVAA